MKLLLVLLIVSSYAMADNPLLEELLNEDQAQRMNQVVERTDAERRKIVLKLLAQSKVLTANDKFAAAMILQHTALTYCNDQLTASSPENYLLAHELFLQSFELGNEQAKYYVAASMDRYLSFTEGYQKYGTNRLYNQDSDSEEWVPIDRKTTDEERAKWGVPEIKKLLEMFPEKKIN